MLVIDSKYVDLKIEGGKIVVEVPLVELLKEVAAKSSNTIDDKLIELLEGALAPKAEAVE